MLGLNERTVEVESGSPGKTVKETIPALHPSRKEVIEFVLYQAPPLYTTDRASYEEWMERMRFIKHDLHKLLQLPYDRFWCQAVFDEKLHRCLDAYLQHAPRRFESLRDLPGEAIDVHQEIHRLVFMSYLRMSTCKETKENFITPKVFGEILYENFIFDIPKIMDLCVLYGRENGPLMTKMIRNIFTQQPRYCDDLKQTLPAICQVFDNICTKCGIKSINNDSRSPQKLTQQRAKDDRLVTMATEEFADVLFYLCDTSFTLTTFLDVYPEACHVFASSILPQRLVCFYDTIIPALEQSMKTRQHTSSKSKVLLKRRLQQSGKHLVHSFHQIVQTCYIQPILENSGNKQQHVEAFLDLYGNIQGERRFLADLESQYPLQDNLDIITQAQCMLDETRVQFIQDGTNTAFATFGKRKKPKGAKNAGGRESPDGSAGSDEGGAMGGARGGVSAKVGGATSKVGIASSSRVLEPEGSDFRLEEEELAHKNFVATGAGAPTVSSVELDSLITAIKDLLPDLGEGFIEQCLEEFNYDQEKVINCVLEDNLPVPLRDLNRALDRVIKKPESEDMVSQRRNIFDFDEFDVFNRDQIDMSRVIIGKKEKNPEGMKSLDDKSELSSLKPLYDRYGSGIMGESVYDPDMYDDEYDDTYDTGIVGARDDDSADELASRRVFTIPRVLQKKEPSNRQFTSDDSSEEEKNKDEFVTNPAVLRARAADRARERAQRDAKQRGQGHRAQGQMQPQGQSQGGQEQSQKKYEVKGKPKGQGQEAGVVRNRNFKDKHKSSLGNHNRKAMADKKRKV